MVVVLPLKNFTPFTPSAGLIRAAINAFNYLYKRSFLSASLYFSKRGAY